MFCTISHMRSETVFLYIFMGGFHVGFGFCAAGEKKYMSVFHGCSAFCAAGERNYMGVFHLCFTFLSQKFHGGPSLQPMVVFLMIEAPVPYSILTVS